MFAPDPVKAFLCHAQRDDDVDVVTIVFLRRVLQRRGHAVPLGRIVIDQIGDTQNPPVGSLDQLETRGGISPLPGAQRLDDVLHLLDLVLRALARIDVGDVDDRLLRRVQHLQNVVGVGVRIEEIADVELLQILIAVELLIVGVGDALELAFVLRRQHRLGVAPEIGPGHRDDMHAVARDKIAQMDAELVVGIGRDVVELIHRDQSVIERRDPEFVDGEAEGRMGADQHLVVAFQENPERIDLAAVVVARCVAQVPFWLDVPVGPEAMLAERFVMEAGADGLFRHDDDGLLDALILQLVERDEHQRAALARGGRGLDQKILLAALFEGALLHRPHAELVGLGRAAIAGIGNRNGGN